MADMWIVVARWDEFQHRDMARSSVPPWIKNFTKLMHDDAYRKLTGHQRAVLHGIWLEYASARRQLILSTTSLTHRLGLRVTTQHLEVLRDAGYIEFSASKPASAVASDLASLEVEVEVEVEKKPPTPFRGTSRTTRSARATKLRYLPSVEAIWKGSTEQEREKRVRVWLEGFTADEGEIQAHIDSLTERSAAA